MLLNEAMDLGKNRFIIDVKKLACDKVFSCVFS